MNASELYKVIEGIDVYQKFIFVREPMERLSSFYNDIFINSHKAADKAFRKKVKKIADKLTKRSKSSAEATFDDFLLAKIVFGRKSGKCSTFHPW